MNNTRFRSAKIFGVLMATLTLWACAGQTPEIQTQTFQEGLYYQKISPALPTEAPDGKVEVVEVFFYACPHCNTLDPKITEWLKGKEGRVVFKRMPAILGPTWVEQAKAYYVAEKLGILDKSHPALLASIHKDGKQYYNDYTVLEFFRGLGVPEDALMAAFNAPDVAEKLSQARVMTVKYGLRGVPALIVDGRYKTAQYYAESQEKMLEVADYLIGLALDEKSSGQ